MLDPDRHIQNLIYLRNYVRVSLCAHKSLSSHSPSLPYHTIFLTCITSRHTNLSSPSLSSLPSTHLFFFFTIPYTLSDVTSNLLPFYHPSPPLHSSSLSPSLTPYQSNPFHSSIEWMYTTPNSSNTSNRTPFYLGLAPVSPIS